MRRIQNFDRMLRCYAGGELRCVSTCINGSSAACCSTGRVRRARCGSAAEALTANPACALLRLVSIWVRSLDQSNCSGVGMTTGIVAVAGATVIAGAGTDVSAGDSRAA